MRAMAHWIAVAATVTISVVSGAAADCGWTWVNPTPPRHDVYRLKFESNRFVGVGSAGTILWSLDGFRWETVDSGVDADLYGIDWGVGRFVVGGEGVVLRSVDGRVWELVYEDPAAVFLDVEYSASRFVAIVAGLQEARVITSPTGDQWEEVPAAWGGSPDSITGTDNGFVVAVGSEIWISENGFDWSYDGSVPVSGLRAKRERSAALVSSDLFELDRVDLAWTGQRLLWAGAEQLWARDLEDQWELVAELTGCSVYEDWLAVIAGPGWAMASGIEGCPTPYLDPTVSLIFSSDGGATFSVPWQANLGGFPALARYGSRWVALGALGDLMTSNNGLSWECLHGGCTSLACADELVDLAIGSDGVVTVGGVGLCDGGLKRRAGRTVATSGDGAQWAVRGLDGDRFRGVVWTGDEFLAVGDGWLARSEQGLAWTTEPFPDGAALHAVGAGNGWVVAVGRFGALYVSPDGITWQKPFHYFVQDFDRVVWDGDQFLVMGTQGVVLRSSDAVNWSQAYTSTEADLKGAAAGPEQRVAVGVDGVVLASPEGEVWVQRRSGFDGHLNDVAWGDGRFVAVGWQQQPSGRRPAVVLASADGDQWTRFAVPGEALQRVRWTGDEWLAVGGERTILRAECVATLVEFSTQHLQIPQGGSAELDVRLSEAVSSDAEIAIVSSQPDQVVVPPAATVPAGSDRVVVTVDGAVVAAEVVLTVTLPEDLGGGSSSILATVQPPQWTPRRPSGRVSP